MALRLVAALFVLLISPFTGISAADVPAESKEVATANRQRIDAALDRAGPNRVQIAQALADAPAAQRPGVEFLVANMPDRDLTQLTAAFLLENCDVAYQAWEQSAWKDKIPQDIFLNDILPYASINEGRDAWRKEFREKFQPLVAQAKSPSEAAAILNQKIYSILNVRYSTGRPKADQSPHESIKAGLASCSGLAVLLVDACRAVGVPARFVGIPLWADRSGNHSWVEIWDDGWHFTGAAEPTGDKLDQAWFIERASTAQRDHPFHAIYATSFRRTPITFPLVWDRSIHYVHAVNVTDRYAGKAAPLADGERRVAFRVLDGATGGRCRARVVVRDADGKTAGEGESKDERFDANDHLTVALRVGAKYRVEASLDDRRQTLELNVAPEPPLVTIRLEDSKPAAKTGDNPNANEDANQGATIDALDKYLTIARSDRPLLVDQPFARQALTKAEAAAAGKRLWNDKASQIRAERAKEMESRLLKIGDLEMPFVYHLFGAAPKDGRSLYISMHGGGGAPKQVNDQQWENQKRLYQLEEGVYVAPRAPTNSWDLWHQAHIDRFFDRLIENLIVFENVNPDRVYLMGYSAGGDGVYQVAPRMADRLAAAAMMAGHPNESTPAGLRNLPFTIHVGGKDAAYNRNQVAKQWGEQLSNLRAADPQGYEHWVEIYEDKGHWLDRKDAAAIPWMAKFQRNPFPSRIVWRQDDVTESRFYWLGVAADPPKAGDLVTATVEGQTVKLESPHLERVRVFWSDRFVDLDRPVRVMVGDKTVFEGPVQRTIAALAQSFGERADPRSAYVATTEAPLK